MHLSKKSEYALRAAINLGIAAEVGRTTISGAELAEANRLPLKFRHPDPVVPDQDV